MMATKSVIHIGPTESRGGISAVIANICELSLSEWRMASISSHSENGVFRKISQFNRARKKLKKMINEASIDVAHIHVTHGLSWWRKLIFLKICIKNNIKTIVHIHSGKFDQYCEGFAGKSVAKYTKSKLVKTVVLEDRWKKKLKKWVTKECSVVRNFSPIESRSEREVPEGTIKLLLLSRGSEVKQVEFAMKVAQEVKMMGRGVSLNISGKKFEVPVEMRELVFSRGWVSEKEKNRLLDESNFLISPSIYEGSSMSVIEAINHGLPVVVSEASRETVGVDELVEGNHDPRIWARKIIHLSEKERYLDVIDKIGRIDLYTPKNAKEAWQNVYDDIYNNSQNKNYL